MTVATTLPRIEYVEDGVSTVHSIPFQFFDASEITVYRITGTADDEKILLAEPTHYSVSGGDGATGSITKVNGGVDTAVLRIDRNTKLSQEKHYAPGDDFPAESHEEALDRAVMLIQELRRDLLTEEAVRDIIAAILVAGDGISITPDDNGNTITIGSTINAEYVFNLLAEALIAGSGITLIVNDDANTITISSTGGGTVGTLADFLMLSGDQQSGGESGTGDGSFAEQVLDIVAAALAGVGLSISYDDAAGSITITNTTDAEFVRDTISAALVAGSGIVITPNDGGDTITIAVDDERIRDVVGATLIASGLLQVTVDDAGNTITVTTSALDPAYRGIVPGNEGVAFSFADTHGGKGINYVGAAAAATIQPNSSVALSSGFTTVIRNNGSGVLTVTRGSGVSLKVNGGAASANAAIAVGGMATLIRWGADDFTIVGPGVS